MGTKRVEAVGLMLDEIDRMRLAGWRWAEMNDWVKSQLADPAIRPDAIRQLVSRARRRRDKALGKKSNTGLETTS